MESVQRFPRNAQGDDYVVGDIHGCFTTLDWLLEDIGFDKTKDRLFSVGDLLNKGVECSRALEYMKQPWFHSVLGNNEYHILEHFSRKPNDREELKKYARWCEDLPVSDLTFVLDYIRELPIAIEVVTEAGLMGIIHGDCLYKEWKHFVSDIRGDDKPTERCGTKNLYKAIFGRERYINRIDKKVDGVERIYCGHSPTRHVTAYGNVHYIDTGAVYGDKLTACKLGTDYTHSIPFVAPGTR